MASADSNIRTIQVKTGAGAAAEKGVEMGAELPVATESSQAGGTRKQRGAGRRARTQKVLQVGEVTKLGASANAQNGGSQAASPGTAVQLAATHIPGPAGQATPPAPVGVDSAATQKGAVLTVAAPAEPAKGGGSAATAPVKVVLAAAKKKKPGLVLASAKPAAAVALKKVIATKPAAGHTRHKARKIKVSMKTLRKKINRAKTIRKSAEGASLEQIKKELQKAGILKADSKAPEGILRQMYADFMTLKSRAL